MGKSSIVAERLSKKYGYTEALKGVDFAVEGSGLVIVYGPNGSGKSTLLRLASGVEKPSSGLILVNGVEPWRNLGLVSRMLVLVAEGTWLPSYYTGLELARMLHKARGVPLDTIEHYAGLLGVSSYWKRPVATYSMGMRKKLLLLLGLSLGSESSIFLFDEPYTLLDATTRRILSGIILDLSRSKLVVIATHILTKAEEQADTAIVLVNGEVKGVIMRETSASMVCEYRPELVRLFTEKGVGFSYDPGEKRVIVYSWEGDLPEGCERRITSHILERIVS